MRKSTLRRLIDITVAGLMLLAAAPLMLVLAVLARLAMGSPVLFRQVRAGRGGRPFTLYKFRSMREAFDAGGRPLSDALRLTRFGRWLRRTSLDELPQLFNVLRGDMSVIGPRPLLMKYLARYTADQRRRHEVRPGITGWAQVNGRNRLSWPEKFSLDVWYVDHCSLGLDIKILAMTLWIILKRDGINQPGQATAR